MPWSYPRSLERRKSSTADAKAKLIEFETRRRAIEFDSTDFYHRNTPHRGGDRYVFVLYCGDHTFHGSPILKGGAYRPQRLHPPTEAVRAKYYRDIDAGRPRIRPIPTRGADAAVKRAEKELTRFLDTLAFPKPEFRGESHSKYKAPQESFTLGLMAAGGKSGGLPRISKTTEKKPEAMRRIVTYLKRLLPPGTLKRYTSLFVAKNAACRWHVDVKNVGPSLITSVGSFTEGGNLLINVGQPRLTACHACFKRLLSGDGGGSDGNHRSSRAAVKMITDKRNTKRCRLKLGHTGPNWRYIYDCDHDCDHDPDHDPDHDCA